MTMRGARACEQPHGDFHVSIPLMAFAAITVPLLRATPAADDAVWGVHGDMVAVYKLALRTSSPILFEQAWSRASKKAQVAVVVSIVAVQSL